MNSTSNASRPPAAPRRVAVIGGGWAGLAAAVRLADRGVQVDVFEAARTLGGRARRIDIGGAVLDNGQHLLIGAYRACFALMRHVGVPEGTWQRLPLALECPGRFRFVAPRLPAPLHILAGVIPAQGLTVRDKLGLLRWMAVLAISRYRAPAGTTVAQWTAGLPAAVRRHMIDPLCVAALNTPAEQASARIFAAVLRDSLGASARDSDLVLPRRDLGATLPDHAARWLAAHGGTIHPGAAVGSIAPTATGWGIDRSQTCYDGIVLATPPWVARTLLAELRMPSLQTTLEKLDGLEYEPITTVYLRPAQPLVLPRPMVALDTDASGAHGQFAFDRGATGGPPGWIAVVISAARASRELSQAELVSACAAQLTAHLGVTVEPAEARVITEKRATFRCTPDLTRPPNALPMAGLVLAGDYTEGEYPATLEHAVRSGEYAAGLLLAATVPGPGRAA